MKMLSVCLALCSLLTLSQTVPLNSTSSMSSLMGRCEYEYKRLHCPSVLIGAYCPQCDTNGNFLPQQCWPSTGYCWCVNVYTGEKILGTETPPGRVPVDCNSKHYCPYGWAYYGTRCFTFINTTKTWIEAEIYCQFEGANLASVHSYDENHFIMSLTRGNTNNFPQTWIGGFDKIHPGHWMWSDGSKFYYENWSDGSHQGPNNCLTMNYGYNFKWVCNQCNQTHPFVCAKKM